MIRSAKPAPLHSFLLLSFSHGKYQATSSAVNLIQDVSGTPRIDTDIDIDPNLPEDDYHHHQVDVVRSPADKM
jgi:hypothetical protein